MLGKTRADSSDSKMDRRNETNRWVPPLIVRTSPACEAGAHLESSYGRDDLGTLGLAGSTLVTCAVIKYASLPPAPPPPGETQEGARHLPRPAEAQCMQHIQPECWALTFPVIHSLWSTMDLSAVSPPTHTYREITHGTKPQQMPNEKHTRGSSDAIHNN